MASTIHRVQKPIGRTIVVEISLTAKDVTDSGKIQKFGDIVINPTGDFDDPNDNTYPKFYVNAGNPVSFFTDQVIRATFEDDTLSLDALQKQANLWGDAISLSIQNALVALRAQTDTSTLDTSVNI